MPNKQLFLLLFSVTLSTLTVHSIHQSALAASAAEVSQQQGERETTKVNPLRNLKIPESWLPRCAVAFTIGGYLFYSRKKRQ